MPEYFYQRTMNKLEELVAGLTAPEVKTFRSTFGKSLDGNTSNLLEGFDKAHESVLKNGILDKTSIYKAITGKKKYNDKEWRYLQTELTDRLENFFMQKYINEDVSYQYVIKYKALTSRNCYKAANYFYDGIKKNTTTMNADFFLQQFEVAEAEVNYSASLQTRTKELNYASVLHNLDAFYLAKKLQLFCEIANFGNVLNLQTTLHLVEEVKLQSLKKPFSEIPIINIYLLILLTLTEPDEESHFKKLNKVITEHQSKLPVNEFKEVYTYIKNYCVKQINQGNTEYIKILFGIYTDYIENKRLMQREYLSEFEFKNIVSTAIRLNEISWCRNFIRKYINYLAPAERMNALNYNQAYFYFQTGDFKLAIRKLRDVAFTDIVYQLDSRVILLKSYYELDEDDQFFYHASAFRLFLLRNRHLSGFQKKINRNLIRFLTALRRNAGKTPKIELIKKEILQEKNVADLNWLLNKVDEHL